MFDCYENSKTRSVNSIVELNGLFNIVGFIISLIAIVVLFSIIKRTRDEVRSGFLYILLGMVAFVLFEMFKVFEVFQIIIGQTIVADVFGVFFVIFLVLGLWKLRSLIRGLSDFGQAFVLTSKDKYEDKLVSLVKDIRGVCYVTLEEPYGKVVDFLGLYSVDTSTMQFIDGSGKRCDAENCIAIKNSPDEIKNTLDRVLKEKDLGCVILDNVAAVKKLQKFELPKFIQDTASLIKANEAQGFFIGKIEGLDKETINDITMLVDKVIGERKW